jgi:hypothetical protein
LASWRCFCAGFLIIFLGGLMPAELRAAADLALSGQMFGPASNSGTPSASAIKIDVSTTDAAGNIYIAGTFVPAGMATLAVGDKADGTPVTLQSPSNSGLGFVAKFDKNGKVVWANSFNNVAISAGTPNYTITAIAIDGASPPNVYVAAQLTGVAALILPSTALIRGGSVDSFVMKFAPAGGSPTVVGKFGDSGFELKLTAITVDSSNNVFIGGTIKGTTTNTSTSNIRFTGDPSVRDGFIARLDNTLSIPASRAITYSGAGGPTNVDIKSMTADADGYVYTVGQFSGPLTDGIMQPFVLNQRGATDIFALRHHGGTMTEQWNNQYAGSSGTVLLPTAIVVDATNIYIGGEMTTSATIDTLPAMTLRGAADGFVLKAGKIAGTAAWANNFGGSGVTVATTGLGVDPAGEIRVGAQFSGGDLTAPALPLVGTGGAQDAAILGLAANGTFTVAKAIGGNGTSITLGTSRGVSTDGMFAVAGRATGDLIDPALTFSAGNSSDALILRAVPPTFTVTVSRTGTGSGTVTSSPGGINCGTTCTSTALADGSSVSLTATADAGSSFAGWGGDCSGASTAFALTLAGANATCTAAFTLSGGPTPPTPTPSTPPAPPPSFVTTPPSTAENVSTIGSGSGSVSFAGNFANPAGLVFTAAPAGGGSLPGWISFEPATATFSYTVPLPGDLPIQPLADRRTARADARADWPNTVYPLLLRIAELPVVLTATDKATGVSYSSTIRMSFHAPRNPVAISAISMSLDRVYGDRAAARSALSHDGGQMIFETAATNLFPAASAPYGDIVRYHGLSGARDRLTQTAIPGGGVANAANGPSSSPAVSADGAYAAFASDAASLSAAPSGGNRQVYRTALGFPRVALNQVATPAADMVSMTAAGAVGNGRSDNPSVSRDGRFVAFDSDATNLGVTAEGSRHVWRKDFGTGDLAVVAAGTNPSISWDGRHIAFENAGEVKLKDMAADTVRTIGAGSAARLSARGDRVAFVAGTQVVQVDVATGARRVVGTGDQPAMSADGRFVAYRSVGAAGNGFSQIWLRDVDRGVTALVTQTASGAGGNGDSLYPALSGDGTQIAFVSTATDLVNGTPTGTQAYLAANPLPLPEKSGYWYLSSSSGGQGWLLERWGVQAYIGGLVYDAAGRSSWVSGFCQLSGLTCSGTLSVRTGGTPFGTAEGPTPVGGQAVGVTLTTAADGRTTTLQVGNAAAQALTMFPIAGSAVTGFAGLPQTGWWMETDSAGGNGFFVAINTQPQPDGSVRQMAYVSVLTYDGAGLPVWYSSQAALGADLRFDGTLMQYVGGSQLGQVQLGVSGATPVGQLRIAFTGNDSGQVNLPNGRTLAISRFRF